MAELLSTEGLTKKFRGITANDNVSFCMEEGGIRCIIGPNGAGKTTFLSMLSGHAAPTSGRIAFRQRDVTRCSVAERARSGIVRKFQTPTLFDQLTVWANVELSVLAARRPHAARNARVTEVLELVRLLQESDKLAANLSHGQCQWLEIGLLIANDAKLLLLDEPTAGMTAEETRLTAQLIRHAVCHLGLSVIIIEHDISFIRDLAAPITVLHMGRMLVEGSFDEISRNEQVKNIYLGDNGSSH